MFARLYLLGGRTLEGSRPESVKCCTKCGLVKPLDEFSQERRSRDGRSSACKACRNAAQWARDEANRDAVRERNRLYRQANLDTIRAQQRQYDADHRDQRREAERQRRTDNPGLHKPRRTTARELVLDHYGRACACCGSADRLQVDHIDGHGRRHRQAEPGAKDICLWLVRHDFPPGFQILCWACNQSKQDGSSCRIDHEAVSA